MDSITLGRMAFKLLKNSGVRFLGVYPSDHLPCVYEISSRTPCCYIANSDPCNEIGSHWVAFYHPKPNEIEFFDSFGKTPAYYGFSIPNNMSLLHNQNQLQSNNSSLCGQWCILFLVRRSQGSTFRSILNKLRPLTPSKADLFVQTYFFQLKTYLKSF